VASPPEKIAAGVYRVDAVRFPNAINVLLLENDVGWTLADTVPSCALTPGPSCKGRSSVAATRDPGTEAALEPG
jgi:hypothetical protein